MDVMKEAWKHNHSFLEQLRLRCTFASAAYAASCLTVAIERRRINRVLLVLSLYLSSASRGSFPDIDHLSDVSAFPRTRHFLLFKRRSVCTCKIHSLGYSFRFKDQYTQDLHASLFQLELAVACFKSAIIHLPTLRPK